MTLVQTGIVVAVLAIVISYVHHRLYHLPPKMDGHSDFEFRDVAQAFRKNIQSNTDLGSAFCVYHNGRKVVDMVGGYADLEFQLPWTADTLTQVFTVSSVSIALSLGMLYQRKALNISDSIGSYLPEFNTEGKDQITFEHLLSHTAGLPILDELFSLATFRDDPEALFKLSQRQKPVEYLRNTPAFHVYTQALYADALVRKIDGKRTLSQFFVDEIARPIAMDVIVGLPRTQFYRTARSYHPLAEGLFAALGSLDLTYMWKTKWNPLLFEKDIRVRAMNLLSDYSMRLNLNPELTEIPFPATHMFTKAKSLAKLFGLIASGGSMDGVKLFDADTIAELNRTLVSGYDVVWQREVTYTLGLQVETSPVGTRLLGFRDATGQLVFADLENQLAFAYVTNHMHSSTPHVDTVHRNLIAATYACVEELKKKKKKT